MERTTIMLPEELKVKVLKLAAKKQISLAQLIRESLEKSLEAFEDKKFQEDPFISDNALFSGDCPDDLSSNHDKYLYEV